MPTLANYKECTGCLACVDSCKHRALTSILNEEGHLVPQINIHKCVDCRLCEKACPIVSKLNYSSSYKSKAYAGWAKNFEIRKNSATAGAFSALAQYVLSLGGVIYGAALVDGLHVKHIKVADEHSLSQLQGSKYTQSNAAGNYREAFKDLKDGKIVLFSGTGCQIAGLYSYIGKKNYCGKLITIDLICGGVPSRFLIDKFVEHVPYKVQRIVSFRSKDNGWSPQGFTYNLKVQDVDGVIHDYSGIRNLITTGFACEMTNRYSCYQCQFAGINRLSDFTIGDYWGVSEFKEQHKDGISVIIVHNEKAKSFIEQASEFIEVHDANISNIIAGNRRIIKTVDRRYKLPERRYLRYLFNKLNYNTLNKIYAFGFSAKSPWMIYKIYRVIISKLINII